MSKLTKDILLNVGFLDVAAWYTVDDAINYRLDGERADANEVLLDQINALYAFALGDNVQYIGKTARTIRKRFAGYRNPARTQPTNLRCNTKIRHALQTDKEIRILVFAPISELRYLDFEINLAAGLEDSLIKSFAPPWNGSEKGQPITEEAEREEVEQSPTSNAASTKKLAAPPEILDRTSLTSFTILLGEAYLYQGLINPGVEASKCLGLNGEPVQILFEDGTEPVVSRINRTANPSGSVRVVGQNRQVAKWFQHHFKVGDTVEAQVLDRNRILLRLPGSRSR